ncbi:hypothetical protein IFM89_016739 [Coptis chinensis]|uniref:Pentatricopeptide repeat-containing protein n=1 Tax=Coptis chinensis TaxID=261450 RepID=A0A835MA45_9MAGN|nr:hypothetical protein IFM89_016739 [Coptis chinensis]
MIMLNAMGYYYSLALVPLLLSMYAKCGCIDDAICVFMEMPLRDALSWMPMILALSMHGKGQQGLACFDEMLSLGETTMLRLLGCLVHVAHLDLWRKVVIISCMEEVYEIALV